MSLRFVPVYAGILVCIAGSFLSRGQTAAAKTDFGREVQPILQASCYSCHGTKSEMGKLRLDAKAVAMKSVKPGRSAESTLYQRIAGIGEQARMPMGGKPLSPAQIATIKKW